MALILKAPCGSRRLLRLAIHNQHRFSGDQLWNSIGCHKLAIRGSGSRLILAIGDSAKIKKLRISADKFCFARHSGGMESTPVGKWKDCDVIMQSANLSTHSRSTAEIDVEQITFCVGCDLGNGRCRRLRLAFLRGKECQNGCTAAATLQLFTIICGGLTTCAEGPL